MKNLTAAFSTELMKHRRSAIVIITLGLFIFISLMMGLLMYVAQHPDLGSKLGLVGAKASFFSENSWTAFFDILNQTISSIGIIGFGFVTAWVFGREYTEQTIKDILALPISRSAIVVSKFIVVFIWCSLLAFSMFLTAVIMGRLIHIPDWSARMLLLSANKFFTTAFYTLLLSTTVGFIAGTGRGIVAPIGFAILMLIIA
ncbi:MAG: ABC transporter permease, partial [Bacteroidales bacterium]